MRRIEDIETVNLLKPDYIGFVFAPKSKRYIIPIEAAKLKKLLNTDNSKLIRAVGVFVDEDVKKVAELLNTGVIDIAQLHGNEDEEYISRLRNCLDVRVMSPQNNDAINQINLKITNALETSNTDSGRIIKAFKIKTKEDLEKAKTSTADYILLDAGAGDGTRFNWDLLQGFDRPYFLAGGLDPENVEDAITKLHPYGVDVSSGIETDGYKDPIKMEKFVSNIKNVDNKR